jgi:hypothetical protein
LVFFSIYNVRVWVFNLWKTILIWTWPHLLYWLSMMSSESAVLIDLCLWELSYFYQFPMRLGDRSWIWISCTLLLLELKWILTLLEAFHEIYAHIRILSVLSSLITLLRLCIKSSKLNICCCNLTYNLFTMPFQFIFLKFPCIFPTYRILTLSSICKLAYSIKLLFILIILYSR